MVAYPPAPGKIDYICVGGVSCCCLAVRSTQEVGSSFLGQEDFFWIFYIYIGGGILLLLLVSSKW